MKKKFFFIIILVLYICTINFYLPFHIKNNLKTYFYLHFREKIEFLKITSQDIFIPIYKIEKISGENFYIGAIKINLFTKKIEIFNGIFSEKFKEKIINLTKDLNYLNIKFKKISFINSKINYYPFFIQKLNGKIDFQKNLINLHFLGFIKNNLFSLSGNITNKSKINFLFNIKNMNFYKFMKIFFNIPSASIISWKKNIDITLNLNGEINHLKNIIFFGKLDDKIKINFNLEKKLSNFIFKNGKIIFFNEEENKILFSGKILEDNSWTFIFKAKRDYLKIPFNNSIIYLSDIDFNYSINNIEGNEIDILKLYASKLQGNINLYNLFNYFWDKKTFSYNFFIDNVEIDNCSIKNLDVQLSATNNLKSINKFNFDIDKGKVLYSFIKKENNIFRTAIKTHNVSIKNLIKFLYRKNLNVDGKFNLTFLGFGKEKIFNTGKGVISAKNITINGINFEELENIFLNHDIKNIKLFDNSFDNSTLKIFYLRGKIGVQNHKITMKNIHLKSKNFIINLKGEIDPENFSNIIFTGKYISKNGAADIIINLNLKEKFLQFIGK